MEPDKVFTKRKNTAGNGDIYRLLVMNHTIKISLSASPDLQQILIAELANIHFDAFEEHDDSLDAFINPDHFSEPAFKELTSQYNVSYQQTVVAEQNWNALWEENFQPVTVEDFCTVRAHFHTPATDTQHEIVITPKMSFGTGHHATTFMMVLQMKGMDFANKTVADFGTGTGILAILAEKLGAASVWAIDNDEWSIENATENVERNNCKQISLSREDNFLTNEKFDIILANINRNVIIENAVQLSASLKPGGQLLLSGLLTADESVIKETFLAHNIIAENTFSRHGWISLLMVYK